MRGKKTKRKKQIVKSDMPPDLPKWGNERGRENIILNNVVTSRELQYERLTDPYFALSAKKGLRGKTTK